MFQLYKDIVVIPLIRQIFFDKIKNVSVMVYYWEAMENAI